jgi:hypothetical protein
MLRRAAGPALLFVLAAAGGLAIYLADERATAPEAAGVPPSGPQGAFVAENESPLTVPGTPPEHAFGLVGDVAMAAGGRSFVLDVLNGEVGLFDDSGRRVARLGRPGAGPGELMGPVAIAFNEMDGALYVLDERRQGIDLFDPEKRAWQRTIPLDFHAFDLCFVSGRLYVLGGRNGFILHEVSPADGRVLRSFAPDADSRNLLLRGYRSNGHLGCAPTGELAFLPSVRPEVARFSAQTGALLGVSPIPGYRAVRVRPVEGGGMQFSAPDGEVPDYGSSILPLPGGDWLLQVGGLEPGTSNPHEFISVRSHRLSARDGQVRPLAVQLPRVMAAGENVFYAVDTSPYPAVRIVSTPLAEVIQ